MPRGRCARRADPSSGPLPRAAHTVEGILVRVVLVAHYYPPHLGGLEAVVRQQAESFREAGHDVHVLTARHSRAVAREEDVEGIRVTRVPANNLLNNRWGLPFPIIGPRAVREFVRALRAADVVIVHEVQYLTSHVGAACAAARRIPIFLYQHVAVVSHDQKAIEAVQRFVYRTAGRAVARAARGVVTYNANVRQFVEQTLRVDPARVVQKYNGIDVEAFSSSDTARVELRRRLGVPDDRVVVVFVGRFVPKKGVHILLDARDPAFEIALVGTGLLNHPNVAAPGVHVLGACPPDEIPQILAGADVFCLPTTGEVFTLAMQEAMATGLPVVVAEDEGYADIALESNCVHFVQRDAASLRRALVDLAGDRPLRERSGHVARRFAREHFSWARNCAEDIEMVRRAVVPGAPPKLS